MSNRHNFSLQLEEVRNTKSTSTVQRLKRLVDNPDNKWHVFSKYDYYEFVERVKELYPQSFYLWSISSHEGCNGNTVCIRFYKQNTINKKLNGLIAIIRQYILDTGDNCAKVRLNYHIKRLIRCNEYCRDYMAKYDLYLLDTIQDRTVFEYIPKKK